MLNVGGNEILYVASQRFDLGFDFGRESNGRENGQGAACETDYCSSATDGNLSKSEKWNGEGDDIGSEVTNDHHIRGIGWDECGRHGVLSAADCDESGGGQQESGEETLLVYEPGAVWYK